MSKNARNIWILFFTLVVVMLGFGLVIPIIPFYVESFGAGGSAMGMLMATFSIMQFIFAPFWGSLSDRIGRKPVIMLGVLGNALSQLLAGFSTDLWMLFASRALAGILSSATLPTALAYIGDSTSREERGGKMGIIGAAMGLGMVLGPGLGGGLAERSLALPFFAASGLSVVALLLVFAFLPESLAQKSSGASRFKGPELKALLGALSGPLGILFLMSFLLSFGLTNFENIFGLYAKVRYDYTPRQVGTVLTVIGLVSAVIQGGLTGPLTRKFGEVAVIRASLASSVISFILLTQARNYPQVLLVAGYYVLSNAMLNPAVASLVSKKTEGGQGAAMGINNSFLSLGRIVGPLWSGFVFDFYFNLPYLTGAAIMLVGFMISLFTLGKFAPANADDQGSPVEIASELGSDRPAG